MAAKWTTTNNVKIVINYNFRKITIYFSTWIVPDADEYDQLSYKAEFDFRDFEVHSLHPEKEVNDGYGYFTLIAKHPPQYWEEHPGNVFTGSEWTRSTKITKFDGTIMFPTTSPLQRQQQHVTQHLPIGEWTAFRLKVSLLSGKGRHRFNEVPLEPKKVEKVKISDIHDILCRIHRKRQSPMHTLFMQIYPMMVSLIQFAWN